MSASWRDCLTTVLDAREPRLRFGERDVLPLTEDGREFPMNPFPELPEIARARATWKFARGIPAGSAELARKLVEILDDHRRHPESDPIGCAYSDPDPIWQLAADNARAIVDGYSLTPGTMYVLAVARKLNDDPFMWNALHRDGGYSRETWDHTPTRCEPPRLAVPIRRPMCGRPRARRTGRPRARRTASRSAGGGSSGDDGPSEPPARAVRAGGEVHVATARPQVCAR